MEGNINFYSISADGRVVVWKLVKVSISIHWHWILLHSIVHMYTIPRPLELVRLVRWKPDHFYPLHDYYILYYSCDCTGRLTLREICWHDLVRSCLTNSKIGLAYILNLVLPSPHYSFRMSCSIRRWWSWQCQGRCWRDQKELTLRPPVSHYNMHTHQAMHYIETSLTNVLGWLQRVYQPTCLYRQVVVF